MSPFQEKYFVFIVSGGRTGTKFLGDFLGTMITDCFSVHEPDVLSLHPRYRPWNRIRTFGVKHMVFDRLRGISGIRNLSQRYLSGKISKDDLVKSLKEHRENYYQSISQNLIVESYSGWYGCLPGIEELYRNHKTLVITRHPKTWIESNMNWGTMYGPKDQTSLFKQERLNPKTVGDTRYVGQWDGFTQFEKLCWAYQAIYGNVLAKKEDSPTVMRIRFEDLFDGSGRYDTLKKLLSFVSVFENKNFDFEITEGVLEKKSHQSSNSFTLEKLFWDEEKLETLQRICGPTANDLGYVL